jgi:type IV pilus assembly protein PilC
MVGRHPAALGLGLGARARFYRDLSSVLASGLAIGDAMAIVGGRSFRPGSRGADAVACLTSRIRAGEPLSQAMERQASCFPAVEVAVVRAAEQSGRLEDALRLCAFAIERRRERLRRLLLGLAYPMLLLHGVLAFAPLAADPWRGFAAGYGVRVAAVWLMLDGGLLAAWWMHRRLSDRAGYVQALRRAPWIGRVWREAGLARYLRALSSLYAAGTPLREATRLSSLAAAEPTLDAPLREVAAQVERGEPLAPQIAGLPCIPEEVWRSISIGEETGALGDRLERAAANLEERADRRAQRMMQGVARIAYVVAAVGVAATVISFYARMYSALL